MVLYLNAQSLVNKVNELSCTLSDLEPDVVLVTETWCNSEISNAYLGVAGYELQTVLRLDRSDTDRGRGGGLLVYTKTGLQILTCDKTVVFNQYCKFVVRGVTFYLIYRSPNSSTEEVTRLAALIRQVEKDCVIIGDFNLPSIDWRSGTARGAATEVLEAVEDMLMSQMVDFSTQVKGNILDLVITNMPERLLEVRDEGRLGKSDHVMIVTEISVGKSHTESPRPLPDWRNADWASMRSELDSREWISRVRRSNMDMAWQLVKDKVDELTRKYVPLRRRRNQNRPIWMTQEILRAIRKKKRLWKQDKHKLDKKDYIEQEKKTRNLIRNAKRRFEKRLASGNGGSNRPFFSYIKHKTKCRPSIGPLKQNGTSVTGNVEMAELLNSCFGEAFTREDMQNIPEPEVMEMGGNLNNIIITVAAVRKKIHGLRSEAAAGPDGLGPRVLKELQDGLAPALAHVFQRSLAEGAVPLDWKKANVTPIFKKGSKHVPGNYRPVSLTSVACKVMESVMRDAITAHLDRNKLIRNSQHGFTRGRSCATNLLEFLEKATKAVDEGKSLDVVFLDFAKAFDKVPRERLLRKVHAHGIRGKVWNWISAWLTGRTQRVVLNGEFSTWIDVLSGVPQGSVLGPLLFLIFINDIDLAVEKINLIKKFADDTKVGQVISSAEDRDKLQEALRDLHTWADTWGMAFNVKKCKVMHIGSRNARFKYDMGGEELLVTEEERDIGVTISSNLKPSVHCSKAARTAQAVLGQIARAFHYRDRHVFLRLYVQYVRPHLEFSTTAWAPWTECDKNILEKVQRKAVGMVSGLTGKDYEARLRELGLQTLEERRHQADMCTVHKIMHGQGGIHYRTWFEKASDSERVTRVAADSLNVKVKNGKLDLRKNFFSVRASSRWNEVPLEMKRIMPVHLFRRAYRRHRDAMLPDA